LTSKWCGAALGQATLRRRVTRGQRQERRLHWYAMVRKRAMAAKCEALRAFPPLAAV